MDLAFVREFLEMNAWAIMPDALEAMHDIVASRLSGKLSIEEIEARIAEVGGKKDSGVWDTAEGVRVIPIMGTISKRMNLFQNISGGTSVEMLRNELEEAYSLEDVKGIILDIDSPGGSADGPFELRDYIMENRGKKPVKAFANGKMASAAYLIGSAADEIITNQVASVGSIGVVTAHYDQSKADEMRGIKRTFLTAGKYKAVGNDSVPLSKSDRAYIQERLDHLYTLFVDKVAEARGVDSKVVLETMADGKVFIGQQSIDVGLADSMGTIESVLGSFEEGRDATQTVTLFSKETVDKNGGGEKRMNLEELKEKYPDLYASVVKIGREEASVEFSRERKALETKHNAEISTMQERQEASEEKIRQLEKKDVIRDESDRRLNAERIMDRKLDDSDIPEYLHDKVRAMVPYTKFVKEGAFDEKAYTEAVETEIADWESKNVKTSVMGEGFSSKEVEDNDKRVLQQEEEDDDAYVRDMLARSGQQAQA